MFFKDFLINNNNLNNNSLRFYKNKLNNLTYNIFGNNLITNNIFNNLSVFNSIFLKKNIKYKSIFNIFFKNIYFLKKIYLKIIFLNKIVFHIYFFKNENNLKLKFFFFKKVIKIKDKNFFFKKNFVDTIKMHFDTLFWNNGCSGVSNLFLYSLPYGLKKTNLNLYKTKSISNSIFNNYFPFYLDKNYLSNEFLDKYRKKQLVKGSHLFNIFLVNTLRNILKKDVYIKYITNNQFKAPKSMIDYLVKTNKWFRNVNSKEFNLIEFFEILVYSLILKESKLFIDYLLLIYETSPERTHQKFSLTLKNLFYKNTEIFIRKYKIKGIYFDYKGKIGAISNAKKKRILYAYGFPKFSGKNMRISHQYRTVETLGGTLGLTFIISY